MTNEMCIICGKPVSKKSPVTWWIRMNTSNEVIKRDEVIPEKDDMGAYRIGSECAKKYPDLAWKE